VRDDPFDDTGLIMEALLEIRDRVRYIVMLLEYEDGEEEEENS
jgi:hypothetical protein